tara:strand:+ start:5526 stop:6068 length:543 start_codon:yes stop_codon:yes gene_type:complete
MSKSNAQPSEKAKANRASAKAAFLIERVQTDSDNEALIRIGRSPSSLKLWNREDSEFKAQHLTAREQAKLRLEAEAIAALVPVDTTDLDGQLDAVAIESMQRMKEITSIPVTRASSPAEVAQIRLASEKVLEAKGILKPKVSTGTQVSVIVAKFANEGKEFDPDWKNRATKTVDVDGSIK